MKEKRLDAALAIAGGVKEWAENLTRENNLLIWERERLLRAAKTAAASMAEVSRRISDLHYIAARELLADSRSLVAVIQEIEKQKGSALVPLSPRKPD